MRGVLDDGDAALQQLITTYIRAGASVCVCVTPLVHTHSVAGQRASLRKAWVCPLTAPLALDHHCNTAEGVLAR